MIKMANVYSRGALFLHSSVLELRGIADANVSVTAKISIGETVFSEASAQSACDGKFSVTVKTPSASFDEYTVTVTAGNDSYTFDRVLFGELWLASGQSNMQMQNNQQPEWEREFCDIVKQYKIRAYAPKKLDGNQDYPKDPLSDWEGKWVDPENVEGFSWVSALATAFSVKIIDFFKNRGEQIPVGFAHSSYGGTPIATWIPDSVLAKDESISYKRSDRENWNKSATPNYRQSSAQYNYIIHPLIGIKARGMLWYQGESDVLAEQKEHIYEKMLITLHNCYKELFAPEGEIFPCICSQIYPWAYNPDIPECYTGYMNRCFEKLTRKYPDEFSVVPVCDLPPIWTYHLANGPIHPAHKYALGRRFAKLVWNFCYEDEKTDLQKRPAMLESAEKKEGVIRLTFSEVGSGLFLKGKNIRGLYIRSENGVYTPAFSKIISERELDVWHPYIKNPIHAAYAISSGETETNLFAGDFPVSPFCTEFTDEYTDIQIGVKPWLSNEYIHDFIYEQPITPERKRSFSFPIFMPLPCSEICYDTIYARSGRSVCIFGEDECFGAYITAKQYRPIDLYNYKELQMSVYNSKELNSFLRVYYKTESGSTDIVKIDASSSKELDFGWERVVFDLSQLPSGNVTRLDFCFVNKESKTRITNIDELLLVPR